MATDRSRAGRLGIVVVNFRAHAMIDSNLRDLDLAAIPGHVVVVDNYSGDFERRELRTVCQRRAWTLVAPPVNLGFGAGVNRGVARAVELGCTTFLLLNPDASVDTRTAGELLAESRRDPMALTAPRIMSTDGCEQSAANQVSTATGRIRRYPLRRAGSGRQPLRDDAKWRSWLTAACLVVSDRLWDASSGMSEDYFLYWEDVDFSLRCREAGGHLAVRYDLTALHDEGGTQDRRDEAKSDLYYFYNCRNRLIFARCNMPRAAQWRWVWTTPRESWRILMRGGRRQLLRSPKPLVAALLGSLSGIRAIARRPTDRSQIEHEVVVTG